MTDTVTPRSAEDGRQSIIAGLTNDYGISADSAAPWVLLKRVKAEQLIDERDPRPEWATRGSESPEFKDYDRGQIFYAVFHNPGADQYLVTARDSRRTDNGRDTVVDTLVIEGAVRPQAEVLDEVRALWNEHIDSLIAFYPIAERRNVDALHEACRVKDAAAPAHPDKKLFDFYNAFHLAYPGKDGIRRALQDVYGPEGNLRLMSDANVFQHWNGGYGMDEDNLSPRYDVTAKQFIRLYEQMGDAERKDFRAALTSFIVEDLPKASDIIGDDEKTNSYAHKIAEPLASLQTTADFGSGVSRAFNNHHLGFWTEQAIVDVVSHAHIGLLKDRPVEQIIGHLKIGGLYGEDDTPDLPTGEGYKAPAHWSAGRQP